MLIKLFGILDLLSALILFLMGYGLGKQFGLVFGLYLIIKSLIFFGWISLVDITAGTFMIFAGLGNYLPFSWLFVFWLLQKGAFSLYS